MKKNEGKRAEKAPVKEPERANITRMIEENAWTLENTQPMEKVFTVHVLLDMPKRVKLGLLANRMGMTPEQCLEYLISLWFMGTGPADEKLKFWNLYKEYSRAYEFAREGLVFVGKELRIAVKPAIMA